MKKTIYYKSYKNLENKTTQLNLNALLSKRMHHIKYGWVNINFKENINSIIDDIRQDLGLKYNKFGVIGLNSIGLFDRVIFKRGKWSYCAGQDYTSEIRYLSRCLK